MNNPEKHLAKKHSTRWLMSRMRTSGSERARVQNGRYADERHLANQENPDELPVLQPIKVRPKFYNGKINYGLLVRFLRRQAGRDWDQVYTEILARIPTRLRDYREMIFWFVADTVEIRDGKPWNKKSQQYIWMGEEFGPVHHSEIKQAPEMIEFYVHPETNKLIRIPQRAFKRVYRKN